MAILSRKFSSSLGCLKEYQKEILNLDISEETKDYILTKIETAIGNLNELKEKFKYMRAIQKRNYE